MLRKIISGGQTGTDQAALRAARRLRLESGGWVPKGCKTFEGPNPNLVKYYNCKEHISSSYEERTWANVKDSDGTLRFAIDFSSAGEICTWNAIQYYQKPYYDVLIDKTGWRYEGGLTTLKILSLSIKQWLKEERIEVLNVAGNSEKTCFGIGKFVEKFLVVLLGKEE